MKKLFIFMLFVMLVTSSEAQYWTPPPGIREIPVPSLPDLAIASFDAYGPVIYYNPIACQQAGPLTTAFIQAHEYGHHYLGHIVQRLFNANNPYVQMWLSANMENEADAYAVQYWAGQNNKAIIQAGANAMWMLNNPGDQTHAPSRVRASNIANHYFQITGTQLFP